MPVTEENKLVEKAKQNIQSFDILYSQNVKRLYSYCYNRTGNKEFAEDITSQTFIQALNNLHKYKTSKNSKFIYWLYRIAHNLIVDEYRKRKKQVNIDSIIEAESKTRDLDTEITKEIQSQTVVQILKKLKPNYQELLSLKYFADMSIQEIAFTLHLKPRRVSVLIHRATKAFGKEYKTFLKK